MTMNGRVHLKSAAGLSNDRGPLQQIINTHAFLVDEFRQIHRHLVRRLIELTPRPRTALFANLPLHSDLALASDAPQRHPKLQNSFLCPPTTLIPEIGKAPPCNS